MKRKGRPSHQEEDCFKALARKMKKLETTTIFRPAKHYSVHSQVLIRDLTNGNGKVS